jgi:hypothetical protein
VTDWPAIPESTTTPQRCGVGPWNIHIQSEEAQRARVAIGSLRGNVNLHHYPQRSRSIADS